jgi:hypothetical protein
MDIYHIWCDLKSGTPDTEFTDAVGAYLGHLKSQGLVEGFRLTRRKLGLGGDGLGEFHIMIETRDMAQLDHAFTQVAARSDPIESLHVAVNSRATNLRFALYRDFPDPGRKRGQEKF